MKYKFKPPLPSQVVMRLQTPGSASSDTQVRNDIRTYMRAREIGSSEAAWRLLEFRNVHISPAVFSLPVKYKEKVQELQLLEKDLNQQEQQNNIPQAQALREQIEIIKDQIPQQDTAPPIK
eukprot:IDg19697t1